MEEGGGWGTYKNLFYIGSIIGLFGKVLALIKRSIVSKRKMTTKVTLKSFVIRYSSNLLFYRKLAGLAFVFFNVQS